MDVPQRDGLDKGVDSKELVLILVIVDVPQRDCSITSIMMATQCLNPCYSGCPATGKSPLYIVSNIFLVLILVIVDVPQRD